MSETRKIVAIMVADVVGYGRLAAADEDRTLSRLRGLRVDLIDPAIAVHRGRIVKRTGDGILAEFRSVVDAVRCAIEVQNGMIERNVGFPRERRIEFRVGVHLGDVVEEDDGDLMGDGVNIAARLEGIASPGSIYLSEDAYRQVRGRLDLRVADLGPVRLKNIAEAIRVYALHVGVPTQAKRATPSGSVVAKRRSSLAALALVGFLIGIAAVSWQFTKNKHPSAPVATAQIAASPAAGAGISVAVSPFTNLSGDPSKDRFADALTDGVTTALRRIPHSSVVARDIDSTLRGKTAGAREIGKELGVRYVLAGSVLPIGDQVRVNAEFIEADSGARLWADQFDAPGADLLSTHDEIVARLARAADLQLTEFEAKRLEAIPAASQDAEDLALRCRAAVRKGQISAGLSFCEQALALEPNNAHALVWLATGFYSQVPFGEGPDAEVLKRADMLVSKALTIDPTYGHEAKGEILRLQGRVDQAIAEFERARVMNPTSGDAIGLLGAAYWLAGQFEKSLESFDKAVRLGPNDPDSYFWYQGKARAYFGLKDYDQAIEWSRRAVMIRPGRDATSEERIISALALAGRDAEAREALRDYLMGSTGSKTIATNRAAAEARFPNLRPDSRFRDYFDRFFDGLRKAGMAEQ